jgi:hypothetical protein
LQPYVLFREGDRNVRPPCFFNSPLHTDVPYLTKLVLLFLLGFKFQGGAP